MKKWTTVISWFATLFFSEQFLLRSLDSRSVFITKPLNEKAEIKSRNIVIYIYIYIYIYGALQNTHAHPLWVDETFKA